jgi:hypothetical protein
MRSMQSTLYSFAVPVMFLTLPLMDLSISDVGAYIKGAEFRSFLSEVLIQVVSSIADTFITYLL